MHNNYLNHCKFNVKTYAKTIASHSFLLCGNAADFLYILIIISGNINGAGLIRHSLRQNLPVFKEYKQAFRPFANLFPENNISVTL